MKKILHPISWYNTRVNPNEIGQKFSFLYYWLNRNFYKCKSKWLTFTSVFHFIYFFLSRKFKNFFTWLWNLIMGPPPNTFSFTTKLHIEFQKSIFCIEKREKVIRNPNPRSSEENWHLRCPYLTRNAEKSLETAIFLYAILCSNFGRGLATMSFKLLIKIT